MNDPLASAKISPDYGSTAAATATAPSTDDDIPVAEAVAVPLVQANEEAQGELKMKAQDQDSKQKAPSSNMHDNTDYCVIAFPCCIIIIIAVCLIVAAYLKGNFAVMDHKHASGRPEVTTSPVFSPGLPSSAPAPPTTAKPIPLPPPPPPRPPPPQPDNTRSGNGPGIGSDDSGDNGNKVIASLDMPRQGPLMDLIHIVDADSTTLIVNEIQTIQHDLPGCEIQVLLVNNIPTGYPSPKSFATALFNNWALGSAETNDGVLVLFMMDIRRIEVAVGASLDPYMNQAWTTSMLQRRAVPAFKNEQYGFGIYNVVMAVSDRLRDIHNGIAHPYRASSTLTYRNYSNNSNNNSQPDLLPLFGFLGVIGAFFSCACCACVHDSKYPMGQGRPCPGCGNCNWSHLRYEEVYPATYYSEGLRRRHCVCNKCQRQDYIEQPVSQLTRSSEHHSHNRSSYSGDSGSSGGDGGGGYSSGGGGGGASW